VHRMCHLIFNHYDIVASHVAHIVTGHTAHTSGIKISPFELTGGFVVV
jgi:hypothetical protein